MSIQKISKEQLRRMGNQEGLILQGCGGDPQEWLDGINQILTEEGILKKGARFEEAYTFEHDGLTCLLFPFKEGMAIEMGRLAMWRLQTHPHFGGTWLSDYVPNRLGGFLQEQEQRIVNEYFVQLTVVNAPVFELPMTGSMGGRWQFCFQLAGGFALLGLLIYIALKKRR